MNLAEQLFTKVRGNQRLIVVAGDTMVDRWIHGRVESCQEGCPKFIQTCGTLDTLGGAANAARSLENWGARVDTYGFDLNDCPVKRRYLEGEKIVFRADDDGLARGDRYQWQRSAALEVVPHASAVLLSDYDKGFLTPEFIRAVADLCRRRGIPCVADCKRSPEVYGGCILKANCGWFGRGWGLHDGDAHVITRGPLPPVGCDLLWPEVPCVNHVGAGDCFAAHLALALAYGFSLREAAAVAHSAGRVYVQHPHSRPPLPAEIASDLATAHRLVISTSTP